MKNIKVSLVQTNLFWEDKTANLKQLDNLIKGLAGYTDLVVLPEMFTTGFSMQADILSEATKGPTLSWMQSQAQSLNSVITGSIIVKESDEFYNRLLWVQPDGSFQTYDKRHLFGLGGEDASYTGGKEQVITRVKGWKVLPLICYDLRFPVWSRNTFDYDLLVYVANWPEVRRKAWSTLLAARAVENQVYTLGVNRVGKDGNGVPHTGDSAVYDYAGHPLLTAASVEGVFTIELKAKEQENFRQKLPFLKDRDNFKLS
jgi:omega-amidase